MYVVVGTIGALRQLDPQGFSAELAVERVLSGRTRSGVRLRIAWEELAPSRAVRFAEGERVLAALDSLPNGSLWMTRFPQRNAVAVAARGEAFAREPSAESLDALQPYLALQPEQRSAPAGVAALANLAHRASPALALEALARLASLPGLAQNLGEEAHASLAALLRDSARADSVRAAALALAQHRKLAALAPELRQLAARAGPLAAPAVEALAALNALSAAEAQRFATSRDPAVRAALLRGAPERFDAKRLAAIAQSDGAGSVRAAALEALARREGVGAADAAVDALFDRDEEVQGAALRVLPAFPKESAELLRARAFGARANDTAAIRPLLAGLSLLGRHGEGVLREIERDHPNEEVRRLAQFLLGRTPEH